jgi:hypothetical protein
VTATPRALDDEALKIGLLMESAQTQQQLAQSHLEQLHTHVQELDGVVREVIRRTLIEEFQGLAAEAAQASRALRRLRRAAAIQVLLWSAALLALTVLLVPVVLGRVLPSASELARLRAERDRLSAQIDRLGQAGARIQWQRCGERHRLCVRIDRHAPAFGEHADYYVLDGY